MTLIVLESAHDFCGDEKCDVAAQFDMPKAVFKRSEAAAQRAGLSLPAFIEQALQEKSERAEIGKPAPNIKCGFVLVNMPESEKQKLRGLARECGMELRHVLRTALCAMRSDLEEWALLKRQTGLSPSEQGRIFRNMEHTN